jgi:hypothetical protein
MTTSMRLRLVVGFGGARSGRRHVRAAFPDVDRLVRMATASSLIAPV